MKSFKELFAADMSRYNRCPSSYVKRFHYYFRKASTCRNPLLSRYYRFMLRQLKSRRGIEIAYSSNIGKGLYLGHPYNITINPAAVIGENCNIHKGVTIGQENRGPRKGAPTIGNSVWIGINAAVVGNITIGDDVLIAPNSFVNRDVPSHSVVFGNPCIIKEKNDATEGYVCHKV